MYMRTISLYILSFFSFSIISNEADSSFQILSGSGITIIIFFYESQRKTIIWREEGVFVHSENEDHGIRSHHFIGNRWGNSGNSVRLYFSGLQNHCRW